MKHTKVIKVPAHQKTVVSHRTCDLCKEVIKSNQPFSLDDVAVAWRFSDSIYPEGGPEGVEITTTHFDICGTCFEAKLLPWLESQGAKPTVVVETSC